MNRTRALGVALILLGAVLMMLGSTLTARAADMFMTWRMPDGTVCVQYPSTGFWPTSEAVNAWNKSDATVVRRDNCSISGFDRRHTIKIIAYKQVSNACGWTTADDYGNNGYVMDNYTWEYVHREPDSRYAVWVPKAMTIHLNIDPSVRAGCYGDSYHRRHVIAHELGHALGMDHGAGSVMGSWSYSLPSNWTLSLAGLRY